MGSKLQELALQRANRRLQQLGDKLFAGIFLGDAK
jgi:hypothetical protein